MSRYVKRPRPEPTDELVIAALIMFGPFALPLWWIGALPVRWASRMKYRHAFFAQPQ